MTIWDDTWPRLLLEGISRGLGQLLSWVSIPMVVLACVIYWRAKQTSTSTVLMLGSLGLVIGQAFFWVGAERFVTPSGHEGFTITSVATTGLIIKQLSMVTMLGSLLACALNTAKETKIAQQNAAPLPPAPQTGPSDDAR